MDSHMPYDFISDKVPSARMVLCREQNAGHFPAPKNLQTKIQQRGTTEGKDWETGRGKREEYVAESF